MNPAVAHNASNDLKRIANLARQIIALDEEVSKLGSLEQQVAETTARLDKVKAEQAAIVAAAAAKAAEIETNCNRMKSETRQFMEDTEREARSVLAEADRKASIVIADARSAAQKMQADTELQLEKQKGEIYDGIERLAALNNDLTKGHAEMLVLEKAIGTARAQLAKLTEEHNAFLARVGFKP